VFAVLPIYWMVNMSFKTNEEILHAVAAALHLGQLQAPSSPIRPGIRATSTA
jgi:ABC-type glycerol-3-phosphate transport system permease component